MKISVITWDASFREFFHTVDSFGQQQYPTEDFEFIWVDFYNNQNPVLLEKISAYPNTRIINLKHDKDIPWHLGKCINAGVKVSKGDLLVIPDGDIIVSKNFLSNIDAEHRGVDNLVLYCRRWDEACEDHDTMKSYQLDYLEKVCQLNNPTNYAGLVTLKRSAFDFVNGYEESEVFQGPGINGIELYIRLRNAGFPIKWYQKKIYHPYHSFTGSSDKNEKKLKAAKINHPWILPYAGLKQSWIVRKRELDLSFEADAMLSEEYLKTIPALDSEVNLKNKRATLLRKFMRKIGKP